LKTTNPISSFWEPSFVVLGTKDHKKFPRFALLGTEIRPSRNQLFAPLGTEIRPSRNQKFENYENYTGISEDYENEKSP